MNNYGIHGLGKMSVWANASDKLPGPAEVLAEKGGARMSGGERRVLVLVISITINISCGLRINCGSK